MQMDSIEYSRQIRIEIIKMVYHAKASHVGGALSMVDLLAVLYNEILRIDPSDPENPGRDRFFLSKGHACTGLYATLALKGFFNILELETYSQNESRFLSHVSHKIPGVELSTGSLGHALPVACGVALAAKRQRNNFRVFVLLSDGELDEGSNWEAILFAAHHKLDNLICVIDYNKIQSLGSVKEVIDLHPLKEKFDSFNWNTSEINGHDHNEIRKALTADYTGRPYCIVANTIKGKGVDFMQNDLLWHYRSPSKEQLELALNQLM